MKSPAAADHQLCPRIQKYVNVARDESKCRDEQGCNAPDCPLSKQFGEAAVDLRLYAYGDLAGLAQICARSKD